MTLPIEEEEEEEEEKKKKKKRQNMHFDGYTRRGRHWETKYRSN